MAETIFHFNLLLRTTKSRYCDIISVSCVTELAIDSEWYVGLVCSVSSTGHFVIDKQKEKIGNL